MNVAYAAGVVASAAARDSGRALEPVGAHRDTDGVELQASAVHTEVLDAALKVAAEG